MVSNVSSFGRSGAHDFIWIRVSAILLTCYTLYLLAFFINTPDITYDIWVMYWDSTTTKIFTMIALLSILIHGWIGMWQVLTDYIKHALLRVSMQFVFVTILFVYLFSGFFILWGV